MRLLTCCFLAVVFAEMSGSIARAQLSDPVAVESPSSADPSPFFLGLPEYRFRFSDGLRPASFAAEPDKKEPAPSAAADPKSNPGDPPPQRWRGDGCWPPFCERPGEITFKAGLRVQGRYVYDDINDDNDFMIRRFRMKGAGKLYDLGTYGVELKVDNSERFDVYQPIPTVENAWMDFTLLQDVAYLKAGLFDLPFSRNALTSDSKLLFMDRTLIKEALTKVGFADNTVGVMLHGRPGEGYFEYAMSATDSVAFDRLGRDSHQLIPAGRVAWYLLDPAGQTPIISVTTRGDYADYWESYLGQGQRLVLGANVASHSDIEQAGSEFDLYAWGVDLLFNSGHWVFQTEYDWFTKDGSGGTSDVIGEGWYAQVGYLINCCWELAFRYENLHDPINRINGSAEANWTAIGLNYYIHRHNLKIQTDYIWKDEKGIEIDNNTFQVQVQLDF